MIDVGDKVYFEEEVKPYKVRASNVKYSVCTKPFNLKRTVLYTIIDSVEKVRGTENLVFGFGAETNEQCQEMLERLSKNETAISRRNQIPLRISKIKEGH